MTSAGWMKSIARLAIALVAFTGSTATADVVDFFLGPTGEFHGRLYAARVDGSVVDGEVGLRLSRDDRSLEFPPGPDPSGPTAEFKDWVRRNAEEIAEILFPSDLESAVQGVEGTEYALQADSDGTTRLGVRKGRVVIASKANEWPPVRVGAGEAVTVRLHETPERGALTEGWATQMDRAFSRFDALLNFVP